MGIANGNYTVTLESYDTLSGVYSTLKTDIITVEILNPNVPPQFVNEALPLPMKIFILGELQEWSLPEIDPES